MLSAKFFARYLLTSKSDSVVRIVARVCVVGVAVGVSAFIIVLSVMNGFSSSTRKRYLTIEPHLVVKENISKEKLTSKLVHSIYDYEVQDIFIRTDDNFAAAIAKGIHHKHLKELFKPLVELNSFQPLEIDNGEESADILQIIEKLNPGEIIIGADLARNASLLEGDVITIFPPESLILPAGEAPQVERATVKGIFISNIPSVDSHYIFYVKGETLTSFSGTASRQTGLEVRLNDADKYDSYIKEVGLIENYETWVERNSSLFLALKLERLTMTIFLSLAALITCFTVITVLILLITQKRKDLGVLLTLGLSPRRLRALFTVIGFMLFSLGFTSGLVIGISVSSLLEAYPLEVLPQMYYERTIPSRLDMSLVVTMSLVAVFIGMITAWLPARRLSEMNPVDVLNKN